MCSFSLCISGDTLGSFVYVPCEVMKQRMQVQGTLTSWSSVMMKDNISMKPSNQMYGYYTGMFQAGCSILKEQGLKGLYAGYISKLNSPIFKGVIFSCCFPYSSFPLFSIFTMKGIRKLRVLKTVDLFRSIGVCFPNSQFDLIVICIWD